MKKLLSLVLCLMVAVSVFSFTGCGKKDAGYKIENLEKDYIACFDGLEHITYENNEIEVSHISLNQKGQTAIEEFEDLFVSLSDFNNNYVQFVKNAKNLNKSARNKLKNALDDFESELKDVDSSLTILENTYTTFASSIEERTEMKDASGLNLLLSYQDLFDATSNLFEICYNFYFNHVLDYNMPKINEITDQNMNLENVLAKINLEARMSLGSVYYTWGYIEKNINGRDLKTFIYDEVSLPEIETEKLNNVLSFKIKNFQVTNDEDFKDNLVILRNSQIAIDNIFESVMIASKEIEKSSKNFTEPVDENYINIIDNYDALAINYLNTLNNIISAGVLA
ncbi:MAG: hypothetical protein E7374_00685 [Clostridiales bacterium]|nr:hypothetical protein [Clostridiales bacterium]